MELTSKLVPTRLIERLRSGYGRVAAAANALGAFAKATAGNVAVEYALCVGGIGGLGVGAFAVVGSELADRFEHISRQICLATRLVCVG
jgi:Flp pilus assembly pilin Flp